jgi:hypothetical protein
MSRPEAAPGSPAPNAPLEQRKCVKCSETKNVTPESWPYRKARSGEYAAYGGVCLACERIRKQAYEARRDKIAALVADVPAAPAKGKADVKDAQRDAVKSSRLDVAKALKAGGKVLNEYAPAILARVLEWSEDPHHENHLWAVQFMAERIVPRKLYEELGGQAAGVGSLHDKRPQFIIQVLPASTEAPHRVIEGEVETVQVLPAPKSS